jgi:hypothetical protein
MNAIFLNCFHTFTFYAELSCSHVLLFRLCIQKVFHKLLQFPFFFFFFFFNGPVISTECPAALGLLCCQFPFTLYFAILVQSTSFLLCPCSILNNVYMQGCTKQRCQLTQATTFSTVVPNICGSSP